MRLERVTLKGGSLMMAHAAGDCIATNCCIHNPSDHDYVCWNQEWCSETATMYRVAPSGQRVVDPDHLSYQEIKKLRRARAQKKADALNLETLKTQRFFEALDRLTLPTDEISIKRSVTGWWRYTVNDRYGDTIATGAAPNMLEALSQCVYNLLNKHVRNNLRVY